MLSSLSPEIHRLFKSPWWPKGHHATFIFFCHPPWYFINSDSVWWSTGWVEPTWFSFSILKGPIESQVWCTLLCKCFPGHIWDSIYLVLSFYRSQQGFQTSWKCQHNINAHSGGHKLQRLGTQEGFEDLVLVLSSSSSRASTREELFNLSLPPPPTYCKIRQLTWHRHCLW